MGGLTPTVEIDREILERLYRLVCSLQKTLRPIHDQTLNQETPLTVFQNRDKSKH